MQGDRSQVVLMVQSAYIVFCYYTISPITIKEFEDIYGEGSWRESKPGLKVLKVTESRTEELETIFLDPFADNWYINLKEDSIRVIVRLGRILEDKRFITIAESNEVITPREVQAVDEEVVYINIKNEDASVSRELFSNNIKDSVKKNWNLIMEKVEY